MKMREHRATDGELTQAAPQPCSECPFRKSSPRGWLGPWTLDAIMGSAFSESGLACHMTVTIDGRSGSKVRACAGSLISANLSCKRFIAPNMVEMQEQLKGHESERDVLTQWDFRTHHTIDPDDHGNARTRRSRRRAKARHAR